MNYETFESICRTITNSAAFIGGLGGLVKAFNNKLKLKDMCIKVTTGSIIASVSGAHIATKVSQDLQPIVIFIIGYMGIEAIDFMVVIFKSIIEKRTGRLNLNDEDDVNK